MPTHSSLKGRGFKMSTDDEDKVVSSICDVIKGSTLLKAGRSVSVVTNTPFVFELVFTCRESRISVNSNSQTTSLVSCGNLPRKWTQQS